MKIVTEAVDTNGRGGWRADCEDLPGTPPLGTGATEMDAILSLFYRMMFSRPSGRPTYSLNESWLLFINKDEPITLNGKIWEEAPFMSRET